MFTLAYNALLSCVFVVDCFCAIKAQNKQRKKRQLEQFVIGVR